MICFLLIPCPPCSPPKRAATAFSFSSSVLKISACRIRSTSGKGWWCTHCHAVVPAPPCDYKSLASLHATPGSRERTGFQREQKGICLHQARRAVGCSAASRTKAVTQMSGTLLTTAGEADSCTLPRTFLREFTIVERLDLSSGVACHFQRQQWLCYETASRLPDPHT